jgi:hypothetical protein
VPYAFSEFVPGFITHGYAPSLIVPPFAVMFFWFFHERDDRILSGRFRILNCMHRLCRRHCAPYSMTAHCIPRQISEERGLAFPAYLMALILPITPRSPNPPGTSIPFIPSEKLVKRNLVQLFRFDCAYLDLY